jgi:predicted lipoprotein with Yx(FWY)xxD motif
VRQPRLLIAAVAVALIAAGCGSSSPSSTTTSSSQSSLSQSSSSQSSAAVKIATRAVAGLGTILVNGHGQTLYTFAPDKAKHVTCTGSCAGIWPPVMVASGAKPAAAGGVNASLLGSDPDPSGGDVVTYAGWPLYTYVSDSPSGGASGQALDMNGGLWYVMSPDGKVITKK